MLPVALPGVTQREEARSQSDCVDSVLASADSDKVLNARDPNLAVADLVGLGCGGNRLDY